MNVTDSPSPRMNIVPCYLEARVTTPWLAALWLLPLLTLFVLLRRRQISSRQYETWAVLSEIIPRKATTSKHTEQGGFHEASNVLRPLLEQLCRLVSSLSQSSSLPHFGKGRLSSGPLPVAGLPPRHLAVIMDGNRRFGTARFSDPFRGHWEGGKTLSEFTRWCIECNIHMLTVYAFSTENWKRDPTEIAEMMRIFCEYTRYLQKEAVEKGVRVQVLSSDPTKLPQAVQRSIRQIEQATKRQKKLRLNLCVSYGARGEIVNACRRLAAKAAQKTLKPGQIDEDVLSRHLLTANLPDPDLVIRTSGEFRLSNFLLYQIAYSELVFLDKTWPEVTREDFVAVLRKYQLRHRRYGR